MLEVAILMITVYVSEKIDPFHLSLIYEVSQIPLNS